jgi:hypothetical protein
LIIHVQTQCRLARADGTSSYTEAPALARKYLGSTTNLTRLLREDPAEQKAAIRSFLQSRGIDVSSAAIAALSPESAPLGDLRRTATGVTARTWRQLPTASLTNEELYGAIARFRADKFRSPEVKTVIYNRLIQSAIYYLNVE